jgi:hypothetical protein
MGAGDVKKAQELPTSVRTLAAIEAFRVTGRVFEKIRPKYNPSHFLSK